MTYQRKTWLAFALAAIWAGLMGYVVTNEAPQQRIPLTLTTGSASEKGGDLAVQRDPFQVRVARLRNNNLAHDPSLNIFAPLEPSIHKHSTPPPAKKIVRPQPAPPPIPVPLPVEPTPSMPSASDIAAQRALQESEAARQEAVRELNRFRFVGFLKDNGVEQAFVARESELFIISLGETIDGGFIVTAVSPASVRIRAIRSGLETTIGKTE